MRSFVNYFIKNEIAANLIMVALIILGLLGLGSMKSTFFPAQAEKIINITAILPGASPEEIEEGIVNKIEEQLKGVTGIEQVTSVSSENSGRVTIEINTDNEIDLVLEDVKNSINSINSFPANMESPIIFKRENIGNVMTFAMSGDVDLKVLKKKARTLEDELRAVDGISKLSISGFPDEEIEIAFREQDLRSYNLTFQQATLAVRNSNLDLTGGTVKGKDEELLIRTKNKSYTAADFRDIVVKKTPQGGVIYLHQIADIQDQWVDVPSRNYLNGNPSVIVEVSNTNDEDLLYISNYLKAYIEKFNVDNKAIKLAIVRDSSIALNQRIDTLKWNGILGFFIVVLLLGLFLHWRLAFWVGIAIPISFAGMFIIASALGVTINIISLFGMILVIGILVDDGIVIAESIYQKYEAGMNRWDAALEGTMEVLPAVFSAIITTVIAFSSFFFIEGTLGEFFSSMAVVVIASLVFSLVEGAIILPTHVAHSDALSPDEKPNMVQRFFDRVMDFLKMRVYAPVLRFSMNYRFLTFGIVVMLFLGSVGLLAGGFVKGTFFPNIENDFSIINLQLPAGTSEEKTVEILDYIEKQIWESNDELSAEFDDIEGGVIQKVQKNIGPSTYAGQIIIEAASSEVRGKRLQMSAIVSAVRKKVGPIDDAEILTFGNVSPFGKAVSVSLLSTNEAQLEAAVEEVTTKMGELAELRDVVNNNQEGLREVNLKLKQKAKYLGLNEQEVMGQVRQGFFGSEVQRLQRGRDEVKVWVRYKESDRNDISKLENMRVRFADGRAFPISEIADLSINRGVININHLDGKREIRIEADVAGSEVSVSDVTATVKENLVPSILAKYPDVSASYEGQNREQARSQSSIQSTMPVIFGMMFFVIALTFRSISQTIAVFILFPFGFIGVIIGHYFTGFPISFLSILGVIALIGILVNDALVFIATYNNNLKAGMPQMEALYEAGTSRFRPIVLTTVTTFAGLAPLLLEPSLQAQFLKPMAVAVSFGLLVVTTIILTLLPALLVSINRFKVMASWAWNGEKPTREAVEPATEANGGYGYLWYPILIILAIQLYVGFLG